jgi:small subunit ribosomal protein S17
MSAKQTVTKKKPIVGEVISDKMDKTIVIKVQRTFMEPMLQKVVRSFKKYKVHDENEQAHVGDIVEVYEGRPMSKTKYLYLSRIVPKIGGKEL